MRAAAIFGLGSSTRDLKPFELDSNERWIIGLPGSPSEADVVLVFGGDGTIHRHLAQLVKLQRPVLVVPCGSGNDFARALGLRSVRDAITAWRKFSSGASNVRAIDLGVITPISAQSSQAAGEASAPHGTRHSVLGTGRYFCCVAGCGLDAEAGRWANQFPRWLRAHGGYALSLAPALFRFMPVRMNLRLPQPEQSETFVTHSDKPTTLIAFANAPAYGNGMKIAPRARMDDGQLDICVVTDIDKFKLLCLFPTVYFGRHLSVPEVEYFQTQRLRLETEMPLDVYADGEYVCRTPVEVGVERAALRVVAP